MRGKYGFFTGLSLVACVLVNAPLNFASTSSMARVQRDDSKMNANLIREVRHQLVMLPYYSVFDNLTYSVEGDKVNLVDR
jgi:hypothetical protein